LEVLIPPFFKAKELGVKGTPPWNYYYYILLLLLFEVKIPFKLKPEEEIY
jgi:hypothetical protein